MIPRTLLGGVVAGVCAQVYPVGTRALLAGEGAGLFAVLGVIHDDLFPVRRRARVSAIARSCPLARRFGFRVWVLGLDDERGGIARIASC